MLIQQRPPRPGTPPDDGDFDERDLTAMEGKIFESFLDGIYTEK